MYTKQKELLQQAEQSFTDLLTCIEQVPARKRTQSVETGMRDKNFRDVLMHVYEWHAMLERWYREGMDGDMPDMPAAGFTWRELDALNEQIWLNYQHVKLPHAITKVQHSHARVLKLIETHHDGEIFTKKYYKWTKTSNLYSYFVANTVSHYKWALDRCEKIKKELLA